MGSARRRCVQQPASNGVTQRLRPHTTSVFFSQNRKHATTVLATKKTERHQCANLGTIHGLHESKIWKVSVGVCGGQHTMGRSRSQCTRSWHNAALTFRYAWALEEDAMFINQPLTEPPRDRLLTQRLPSFHRIGSMQLSSLQNFRKDNRMQRKT